MLTLDEFGVEVGKRTCRPISSFTAALCEINSSLSIHAGILLADDMRSRDGNGSVGHGSLPVTH